MGFTTMTALHTQILCVHFFSCGGGGGFIVQTKLSGIQGRFRKATLGFTDRRVKLLSEVLAGIRVIKFYAWYALVLTGMLSFPTCCCSLCFFRHFVTFWSMGCGFGGVVVFLVNRESSFIKRLLGVREDELGRIKKVTYLKAVTNGLFMLAPTFVAVFVSYDYSFLHTTEEPNFDVTYAR